MSVVVVDKDGKKYSMAEAEARAAVESGAYEYATAHAPENKAKSEVYMPKGYLKVREIKTGKEYIMPGINAREAVSLGFYEFVDGKKPVAKDVPTKTKKVLVEDKQPVDVAKDEPLSRTK